MAKAKNTNDLKDVSFEEAIGELTDIVGKIEGGQTSLDDSLAQYEKGMMLIKHCRGILQKAEKKIEKIAAGSEKGGKKEEKIEEEPCEDSSDEGLF